MQLATPRVAANPIVLNFDHFEQVRDLSAAEHGLTVLFSLRGEIIRQYSEWRESTV